MSPRHGKLKSLIIAQACTHNFWVLNFLLRCSLLFGSAALVHTTIASRCGCGKKPHRCQWVLYEWGGGTIDPRVICTLAPTSLGLLAAHLAPEIVLHLVRFTFLGSECRFQRPEPHPGFSHPPRQISRKRESKPWPELPGIPYCSHPIWQEPPHLHAALLVHPCTVRPDTWEALSLTALPVRQVITWDSALVSESVCMICLDDVGVSRGKRQRQRRRFPPALQVCGCRRRHRWSHLCWNGLCLLVHTSCLLCSDTFIDQKVDDLKSQAGSCSHAWWQWGRNWKIKTPEELSVPEFQGVSLSRVNDLSLSPQCLWKFLDTWEGFACDVFVLDIVLFVLLLVKKARRAKTVSSKGFTWPSLWKCFSLQFFLQTRNICWYQHQPWSRQSQISNR